MTMIYYCEEILHQAQNLINKRDFTAVVNLLTTELKAPYTPQPYYDKFVELLLRARQEIALATPPRSLTDEELLSILFDDDTDEEMVVSMLSSKNVHPFKTEIKRRIETVLPRKFYLRGLLIELLISQHVDIELILTNKMKINPSFAVTIFANPWFNYAQKALLVSFDKDPAMLEVANNCLRRYLLSIYNTPPIDDIPQFVQDFSSAIRRMFNAEVAPLTDAAIKIREIIAP